MNDYWSMDDDALAESHRELVQNWETSVRKNAGDAFETLAFIEDAILQRIGAPDDANPDTARWQRKIREFADREKVSS